MRTAAASASVLRISSTRGSTGNSGIGSVTDWVWSKAGTDWQTDRISLIVALNKTNLVNINLNTKYYNWHSINYNLDVKESGGCKY